MQDGSRLLWDCALLGVCLLCLASCASPAREKSSVHPGEARQTLAGGRFAGKGIVIGLEYAVSDNPELVANMARAFAETGMTGMKHFPDAVSWGKMQKGPDAPIDFEKFDEFVQEYQNNGFTELTVALKPHSRWGSKDVKLLSAKNASPKPEYRQHFANWVQQIVERYDGDGVDDMPGLRWPVRYVEIGTEFSSYQPEPVAEYLETLQIACEAAHRASENVRVGHAAFLITPVNLDVGDPRDYEKVWDETYRRDTHHGLGDIRAILDHPEWFDVINIHNLGDPYEIEHIFRWLKYETGRRGYEKPVIISDTVPTSYIGWGPATTCKGKPEKLGILAAPATEADRCRLANFFTKLVNKDPRALAWTRGFVAADHVQRTVIAAEQGALLINLSFTGDIVHLTGKLGKAGAGISAWGGAVRAQLFTGKIVEKYPLFYAIQQLMAHLNGYDHIERVEAGNARARVYRVERNGKSFWIAWRDPRSVLLPEDGQPGLEITLDAGANGAVIEPVITEMGQTAPVRERVPAVGGQVRLTLTHTPVYCFPADI